MRRTLLVAITWAVFSAAPASADKQSFFTDASLLEPWDRGVFDLHYAHPQIVEKARHYKAVMIDQPEIHIAADSKYQGAKGDHLKQLADVGRLAMAERLEAGGWPVVDEAGPRVIFLRWAVDLSLKKKPRGILSYTPAGFLVHETSQAMIKDLWKKVDIVGFGLKIEWLDSVTGEVLSAGTISRGVAEGKALVSWEELDATFKTMGEQTRCHLDNKRLPEGNKRQDCDDIVIQP